MEYVLFRLLIPRLKCFGLNLGPSIDRSAHVEDLSLTGERSFVCTTNASTHNLIIICSGIMSMVRVIKRFKETKLMGLKPISSINGYGLRAETKMWFQLNNNLWFNFTSLHFEHPLTSAALSPNTSRDIGHAQYVHQGLRQFMQTERERED